ncbi:MAG: hypothetical protein CVV13_01620 [Gammaproteobacteria bacterium HGW-Gammaproteobacteria-3]|nr:MAG: hypothetical protein CVV13_01620 [Gammaproteobacteria bacterium HGW-Gammaproteobacteria-3]
MPSEAWGLMSLFVSSFVSSTLAPGGSEAVLAYMVSEKVYEASMLVMIASIGNTLGAMTTWYLGALAARKFPLETSLSQQKQKAVTWLQKWGRWVLLLTWLPVIGDGLCFAGGWLKFSLISSSLIIFIGKLGRYAVIAWLFAAS